MPKDKCCVSLQSARQFRRAHFLCMLCEIAWVIAGKRNTYLSAWYWRIKQKKGAKKAIVALARKLLVIIYTMLKQGTVFDESCFETRRKHCEQKQLSRYIRESEKHGYHVEAQS